MLANRALKPLKWYKTLATTSGRRDANAFLVEGDRAIRQIIDCYPDKIIEIITARELPPVYYNFPRRTVTESQLNAICHTKTPQGPVAVIHQPPDIYSANLPQSPGNKLLLLEDVQDPGNVGTLIRSAAAFNFSGIILTERSADPLSPKCVQSTAGTVLSLWLRRTSHYLELVARLKKEGYFLIVTDLNGIEELSVLASHDKLLLALGNEASGLTEAIINLADYRLRIPIISQRAQSLNIAACGAICMYLSDQ